jgi:hypothetical protein
VHILILRIQGGKSMKIVSSLQEFIHGRYPTTLNSTKTLKQSNPVASRTSTDPGNISFQKERDLYEALSIALTARSLIQKAIEISSRLRNLSQEVIITGNRNPQEYRLALAEINNSLQKINNNYTSPVFHTNPVKPHQSSSEEPLITLPDIRNELETITALASREGITRNDIEDLDIQIQNMRAKSAQTDILQSDRILPSHRIRLYNHNDENIPLQVKNAASTIIEHSERASLAQGHLNPHRVMTLFQ